MAIPIEDAVANADILLVAGVDGFDLVREIGGQSLAEEIVFKVPAPTETCVVAVRALAVIFLPVKQAAGRSVLIAADLALGVATQAEVHRVSGS